MESLHVSGTFSKVLEIDYKLSLIILESIINLVFGEVIITSLGVYKT